MEPRIQYVTTSDGVSIAYWTLGAGMPFVQTPPMPFSQVQLAGQMPEDRRWGALITRNRMMVRYDARGTGLSDRDVSDFSLEALLLDLEAVVDRLGVETFDLWGQMTTGPVAITYAARHPQRVSHLVLWSTWARSVDILRSPAAAGLIALLETDWDLFTETAAHAFFGWAAGELAHRAALFLRENTSQKAARAMIESLRDFDVTDLLPQVQAPTLVLHSRQAPLPDMAVARDLVSQIADARLVLLEGAAAGWDLPQGAAVAIDEFFGGTGELPAAPRPAAAGALVTVLFTDIESSTALTQRLGDERVQELVRAHNAVVRDALRGHGGTEIKHTGDGIMASFPTASGALDCAIEIERAVAQYAAQHTDAPLAVHIGLNAGEPIAEEADLFGTAVQLPRRICDEAQAGEILVSNVVRELAAGKSFRFVDRGKTALRGFEDPVSLYELRWREDNA